MADIGAVTWRKRQQTASEHTDGPKAAHRGGDDLGDLNNCSIFVSLSPNKQIFINCIAP